MPLQVHRAVVINGVLRLPGEQLTNDDAKAIEGNVLLESACVRVPDAAPAPAPAPAVKQTSPSPDAGSTSKSEANP